jgi:hypothetical protein
LSVGPRATEGISYSSINPPYSLAAKDPGKYWEEFNYSGFFKTPRTLYAFATNSLQKNYLWTSISVCLLPFKLMDDYWLNKIFLKFNPYKWPIEFCLNSFRS